MIRLYHCPDARSFRALWALEELSLPYELEVMPFPPRSRVPGYRDLNPLGTVPVLFDGEHRLTESAAMAHYLGARYGPTDLVVGHEYEASVYAEDLDQNKAGGDCGFHTWTFTVGESNRNDAGTGEYAVP